MSNEMNFLEQTFQVLFHESIDVIFLISYDYNIIDCNMQACRVLGSTLSQIKNRPIFSFFKEKARLNSFLEETKEKGRAVDQFTLITINTKNELKYGISSGVVQLQDRNLIMLICRDLQHLSEYEERQELIYDLFQHELLNKLHAQIGYIDFTKRILTSQSQKFGIQHVLPMLEKIKDISVRTMYNIQNASILFKLLDNPSGLANMDIADAIVHALRYIKSFFSQRITIEIEQHGSFLVAADEYLYRLFVNIIVRMLNYTTENVNTEIYIEPSSEEEARVILHFEGLILNEEQKEDFLIKKRALERKNLDVILIQNLIERYRIQFSVSTIKRGGVMVGTKMVLRIPVVEWDTKKE